MSFGHERFSLPKPAEPNRPGLQDVAEAPRAGGYRAEDRDGLSRAFRMVRNREGVGCGAVVGDDGGCRQHLRGFLGVRGEAGFVDRVREVCALLTSPRAVFHRGRAETGRPKTAVIAQTMTAAAAMAFSLASASGECDILGDVTRPPARWMQIRTDGQRTGTRIRRRAGATAPRAIRTRNDPGGSSRAVPEDGEWTGANQEAGVAAASAGAAASAVSSSAASAM